MILTFTFKLIQLIVLIKKCKTISLFSFFNHYQYVFQYTYIKDNKWLSYLFPFYSYTDMYTILIDPVIISELTYNTILT